MGLYDWLGYGVSHGFYSSAFPKIGDTPHFANDIGTPFHTPITALFSGTVVSERTGLPWGTEVFIQPDNGNIPKYYYYHLDTLTPSIGQHVSAGDEIGLSGGQTSGGQNPSECDASKCYSTGPHTHVGFFRSYVTVLNDQGHTETIPYGPDISGAISNLAKGANVNSIPGATGVNQVPASGIPVGTQAFFIGVGQKIGLILVALTLLGIGMYLLFTDQVTSLAGKAGTLVKAGVAPETLLLPKAKSTSTHTPPKKEVKRVEYPEVKAPLPKNQGKHSASIRESTQKRILGKYA